MKQILINQITITIEKKRIKNMYLRILPPEGRVHISAPLRMSEEEIKRFVLSKMDWILQQQKKLQNRHTHEELTYSNGEELYVWGKCYHLSVVEGYTKNAIHAAADTILLSVKAGCSLEEKKKLLDHWYINELQLKIPSLMEHWERIIGVTASGFRIRDMKTRWGTCNIRTKTICFNLQLAKKDPRCLEYVVIHELVHLLEKSHNHVFKAYMTKFLPEWKQIKGELNGTTD